MAERAQQVVLGIDELTEGQPLTSPQGPVIADPREFYTEIMRAIAQPDPRHNHLTFWLKDPRELWAFTQRKDDNTGRAMRGKIKHQVELRHYDISLKAVIGRMTRAQAYDHIMCRLHATQVDLGAAQPGEWRPIAVSFENVVAGRLEQVPNPNFRPELEGQPGATDAEQIAGNRTTRLKRPQAWARIHIVWAERTGREAFDRLQAQFNNGTNPRKKFIETGDIHWAPGEVAERYWVAEQRHRRFIAAAFPDGLPELNAHGAPSRDVNLDREVFPGQAPRRPGLTDGG